MQAHPLSTSAARISLLPSTPSPRRTASTLPAPLFNKAVQPQPLQPFLQPSAVGERSAVQDSTTPQRRPVPLNEIGLAHDAGNLLGALQLYSDMLRAPGVLLPEHQHYAAELELIASRSSSLIQRWLANHFVPYDAQSAAQTAPLLDVARGPRLLAGPTVLHPSSATVLHDLAPLLERIAQNAALVSVTTSCVPQTTPVSAEALERITVNLVRNAAEAIRTSQQGSSQAATLESSGSTRHSEPGRIRVTLDVFGGALRLTVEDNGAGMPPAVAAAFLRPGSMPAHAGRGLGHRIVHALTEETGGRLSVRVRPGRGTALSIRWPLVPQSSTYRTDVSPC